MYKINLYHIYLNFPLISILIIEEQAVFEISGIPKSIVDNSFINTTSFR